MTRKVPDFKEASGLVAVLTSHYRSLVSARSDGEILRQYSALLRFLKTKNNQFVEALDHARRRPRALTSPAITAEQLRKASLEELEKMVSDTVPRRDLEYIAVERFSVPRGSIRSFSNKQMLVEKLRTLIDNERTHETIRSVARGCGKQTSESSR